MIHLKRPVVYIILLFAAMIMMVACGEEDEPDVPADDDTAVVRTILIYAVNRSSLSFDFRDDSSEMLAAMERLDPAKFRLLVFRTDSETECGLYKVQKTSNDPGSGFDFVKIKDYPRDVPSTNPRRVKEVMEYALNLYPASAYDLIFWGHGTSWKPHFSDNEIQTPQVYAYGGEYNPGSTNTDWTDIDGLASAVPDGRFQTIWFDCCYMTGIEVLYQFRSKCDTFVGYPTEVWQYGMQYDIVLPYLMRENPDVVGGATAFYNYYHEKGDPVTVAVVRMDRLESLADCARQIMASGQERPDAAALLNYSRTKSSPFYDFGQFMKLTAVANGAPALVPVFDKALSETVVYHAESDIDFNRRKWNVNNISGLSTHFYKGGDSRQEAYYRTLDWYRRVYE